jgi:hypothetical protein
MQPNVKFNIFVFNDRVQGFAREMEAATPENKDGGARVAERRSIPRVERTCSVARRSALGIGEISRIGPLLQHTARIPSCCCPTGQPTPAAVVRGDQIVELISQRQPAEPGADPHHQPREFSSPAGAGAPKRRGTSRHQLL